MKISWYLAGRLLYNQDCKKDTHIIRKEDKRAGQDLCPREGDSEENEDCTFTLESGQAETQTGCPKPDVIHRAEKPFG